MRANDPLLRTLATLAVALPVFSASGWSSAMAQAAVLEPVSEPMPSVARVDMAVAKRLMAAGRFEAALNLLRPLASGQSVHADALFRFGVAALEVSQQPGIGEDRREALLDDAVGAFHMMLIRRPELVRVRLELGRALFLKGKDELATRHFERVLAGRPPAPVVLNVNRFLNLIRARKRWSLRLGMALAPDTNIRASSEERIIWIHGLPFRREEEKLTTSGIGISAWAGGEYQVPLGGSATVSGASRWRLRAGGDVSRREYGASEFDRLTVAGHVGPRWLIGRGSEGSLLLSGLHVWTGSGLEQPSHRDIGLRLEARHRVAPRTTLNARLSRHERRYDKEDDRDGPITDLSLGVGWIASPTLRMNAQIGGGREWPELERWRNSRRWVRVGATAALPWGFTVGGSGALRWTDWEGSWFPFVEDGGERRDLTRTLRLFAHNRALTLEGFSLQISVTREQRTSNAQLHDYGRTFGELRFVQLY